MLFFSPSLKKILFTSAAFCVAGGIESFSFAAQKNRSKPPQTLTIHTSSDVDYIDCRETYYQVGFILAHGLCRTLYSYAENQSLAETPQPDLAASQPEISGDRKVITIQLRRGIRFAPPVNREVKAQDVEYAIESTFTKDIPNGYTLNYLKAVEGVPKNATKRYKNISGIRALNDHTLQFVLTKPVADSVVSAMTLPAFTAVPPEFARKFDRPGNTKPFLIATGPYMLKSKRSGEAASYIPGRKIELVRNPNWKQTSDHRNAYLDRVLFQISAQSPERTAHKTLTGKSQVTTDFIPPKLLHKVNARYGKQVSFASSGGERLIALNSAKKPFDNQYLRYAVFAAMDRRRLVQIRGGAIAGSLAQHYLPPGFPGFQESGGAQGFGFDFLANPNGNLNLAKEYLKKAGFPDGKFTGIEPVTLIGYNTSPGREITTEVARTLEKLGFATKVRFAPPDVVYSKFCNVPQNQPDVCPSVGWFSDFASESAILQPLFDGREIHKENNTNWGNLDSLQINQAIDDANLQPPGPAKTQAWTNVNRLALEQAVVLPYIWETNHILHSRNVHVATDPTLGIIDIANSSIQ